MVRIVHLCAACSVVALSLLGHVDAAPEQDGPTRARLARAGTVAQATPDSNHALPPWVVHGSPSELFFGWSVAKAGDLNGDGFSDLLIGSTSLDLIGRVHVHLGSAEGFHQTPDVVLEGAESGDLFGRSVSTAGDVNGDGYDDFLVGAPRAGNDRGKAFLFAGQPEGTSSTPVWVAEGSADFAQFGYSVSTAGDVNGDGFDDVIVGAPDHHVDSQYGRAVVYYGSREGLSLTPDWAENGDAGYYLLGSSVGTAGDVNGDGYDDVLVGLPWYTDQWFHQGRVELYLGSPSGPEPEEAWSFDGTGFATYLGLSVSTAGDVNQDGFADLIVGAPGSVYYDVAGAVYVFYGASSVPYWYPDWILATDQEEGALGNSVAAAGDVDGDSYDDVIIGAWGYAIGFPEDPTRTGAAFVYRGTETGLDFLPYWVGSGEPESGYGGSVSTLGDVNADGKDDVTLAAGVVVVDAVERQAVHVYFGPLACQDADGDGSCPPEDCDDDNPHCTEDCTDADGDGHCLRQDCDDTNPNCTAHCTDFDGDGFCFPHDCDPADPDCTDDCQDEDGDGLRVCSGDCDDTRVFCGLDCTNDDGDEFCAEFDCNDSNPNCTDDCTDVDLDGFCVGHDCHDAAATCTTICADEDQDGLLACLDDCDDSRAQCRQDCTNVDGDDYCAEFDCDDTRPNCTSDCTDLDGDSYCVTTDCDDDAASCSVDCTDADLDSLRACDGDCDDANPYCGMDCTDADGDGVCVEFDCDDLEPACTVRCGTVNSDADRLLDLCDNCPLVTNEDQADLDQDGAGDVCDICPDDPNYALAETNLQFTFPAPVGATHFDVGPSGNVYFGHRQYLDAYSGDGIYLSRIDVDPQAGTVWDTAVGPNELIYLAGPWDGGLAYDTTGRLVLQFPAGGLVDVDRGGFIYTVVFYFDPYNGSRWVVEKFHPTDAGGWRSSGHPYNDSDQDRTRGICADREGYAFLVLAPQSGTVVGAEVRIRDLEGEVVETILLGQDVAPVNCEFDSRDILYVGDRTQSQVLLYDRSGRRLSEINVAMPDQEIVKIAIGPADRLFVLYDSGDVAVYSLPALDWDHDTVQYCDNCPIESNAQQSDRDLDGEGDACDLDDGMIYLHGRSPSRIEWQQEQGFDSWNCYRGDLAELPASGDYTQAPGSNALALAECGLLETRFENSQLPNLNQVAFYLVTGVSEGIEGNLGEASSGGIRPNANPCP